MLLAGSVPVVGAARAATIGTWELVGYGLEKGAPHSKDYAGERVVVRARHPRPRPAMRIEPTRRRRFISDGAIDLDCTRGFVGLASASRGKVPFERSIAGGDELAPSVEQRKTLDERERSALGRCTGVNDEGTTGPSVTRHRRTEHQGVLLTDTGRRGRQQQRNLQADPRGNPDTPSDLDEVYGIVRLSGSHR